MHEDREKAVAAIAAGRSFRAVSKEFGASPPTIMRWFREADRDEKRLMADALLAIKAGHSIALVARVARVRRATLWAWLRASLPCPRGCDTRR